jgi:uncharacterized protein (TIGR00369 family)
MPDPRYAETPADFPTRDRLLSMSGMEFMQGMLAGEVIHSGISRLMGYRLDSVAPGRVTFRGAPGIAHANPVGAVHGGWYGTLLDSAMGCAVMTAVPRGRWYTTLEYKVGLIRAIPMDTEVICIGLLDHAGRRTGVAHGEIRGVADDRLYATGSTTCIILD